MKYRPDIQEIQGAAPAALIPTVIEQTHRGERGWDLYSAPRSTTASPTW
jgi:hypothetical protein